MKIKRVKSEYSSSSPDIIIELGKKKVLRVTGYDMLPHAIYPSDKGYKGYKRYKRLDWETFRQCLLTKKLIID